MPWIFTDSETRATLLRQGGGKVKDSSILVCVPEAWATQPLEESHSERLGRLAGQGRDVWRCRGNVQIKDTDGGLFIVRTGQSDADVSAFALSGHHYWLDFLSPSTAFRGKPGLSRITPDGHLIASPLPVRWLCNKATAETFIGPITAVVCQDGETVLRNRVILLPETASHKLRPDGASQGDIILSNWGASGARLIGEGASLRCDWRGADLVMHFSVAPDQPTPEHVEVELLWPGNTQTVRVRLPFPALGVRGFHGDGGQLNSDDTICAQKLVGIRLSVVAPPTNRPIYLALHTSDERHHTYVKLSPPPGSHQLTVRLQDYAVQIAHLLSIDIDTDAKIRFSLKVGDAEPFKLVIRRYDLLLNRADGALSLGADALSQAEGTILVALRLQDPSSEPDVLPTESVNWSWRFGMEKREPGAWLIYPAKESTIAFRPQLWPVPGEVTADTPIAKAIGLSHPDSRSRALDGVVSQMCADFSDPGWNVAEVFSKSLGHLPLSNLDLWKAFAASGRAMACLHFRMGKLDEAFRFRFDQELPFAWECISTQAWRSAIEVSRRHIFSMLPEGLGESFFADFLKARTRELLARHPALAFQIGIAMQGITPAADKEFVALKQYGLMGKVFLKAEQDALIKRQAENTWPVDLDDLLTSALHDVRMQPYLIQPNMRYQFGVLNLPVIVALQASLNASNHWFNKPHDIHLLRTVRHFDPIWFDAAYSYTLAKFVSKS